MNNFIKNLEICTKHDSSVRLNHGEEVMKNRMVLDYHKDLHVHLPEITEVKDNDQRKIPNREKDNKNHLSKIIETKILE